MRMAEEEETAAPDLRLPMRMDGRAANPNFMADIHDVHQDGWDDAPLYNRLWALRLGTTRIGSLPCEMLTMMAEMDGNHRELSDQVTRLTTAVETLHRDMLTLRALVVPAVEGEPERRWYAVARGKWIARDERFESFVTDQWVEYLEGTHGVWMPVSSSFHTEAEALAYIDQHGAQAMLDGMKQVHRGEFARKWYNVTNDQDESFTIVATAAEANNFVRGRGHIRVHGAGTVQQAMDVHGDAYNYINKERFEVGW